MTVEYRRKRARREAELNRRRRRAVMCLIAVIAVVWAVKSGAFISSTKAADDSFVYVCVEKGDTLWGISSEYRPEGEDIRSFVRVVASYNDLEDLSVREGEILKIPR